MTRRSIEQRLSQLDEQRKALQARLSQQERAKDTRRKVLLGALVLARLEDSGGAGFSKQLRTWVTAELPGFLTREADHALFPELLGGNEAAADDHASGGKAKD